MAKTDNNAPEKLRPDEYQIRSLLDMTTTVKNKTRDWGEPARRDFFSQVDQMTKGLSLRFWIEIAQMIRGEIPRGTDELTEKVLSSEPARQFAMTLADEHNYAERVASKILKFIDEEYPREIFCHTVDSLEPINALVVLKVLEKMGEKTQEKAKQILSARGTERSKKMLDIQHGHSRKLKAEAIDYYRRHPELTQAKCIDYLREYFPNGQKRPELLTHSKVKSWLNGSRKK